jgi:hypothetical protein
MARGSLSEGRTSAIADDGPSGKSLGLELPATIESGCGDAKEKTGDPRYFTDSSYAFSGRNVFSDM